MRVLAKASKKERSFVMACQRVVVIEFNKRYINYMSNFPPSIFFPSDLIVALPFTVPRAVGGN